MTDVLLTYGWVRSSYSALRNLSSHGIRVWVADCHKVGMCQWSRRRAGFDRYASHYDDEEQFLADILRICAKREIRVILASHNETEVLARHRHLLPGATSVLLPDVAHCELFNNKAASYEFAKRIGIPVPLRVEYEEPQQLAEAIGHAGLDRTVIKLLKGNSAKGVFYAETPEEAQQLVQHLIDRYRLTRARYPQVEQRVEGEGWGHSVLYWKGQQIANFTHRRLREKLRTGGTSTLRETASHAELENAAKRLFDEIGWHGLAMSEFKVCPKTGQFWFIEVNPRMWGSIPMAISAGVEFPYLAWISATEGPDAAIAYHRTCHVRKPWKGRWLLGDLLVAGRHLIHLQPRATWEAIFGSKADSWDDLYLDDPLPFAGELLYYVTNALTKRSLNPSEEGMVG